jgi:hypothetical protein
MPGTPIADLNLPKRSASLIGTPATYLENTFWYAVYRCNSNGNRTQVCEPLHARRRTRKYSQWNLNGNEKATATAQQSLSGNYER